MTKDDDGNMVNIQELRIILEFSLELKNNIEYEVKIGMDETKNWRIKRTISKNFRNGDVFKLISLEYAGGSRDIIGLRLLYLSGGGLLS